MTASASSGETQPSLGEFARQILDAVPRGPHAVLGVGQDAGRQLVRVAWRERSRRLHPDRARSVADADTTAAWRAVQDAYEALNDQLLRRRRRRHSTPAPSPPAAAAAALEPATTPRWALRGASAAAIVVVLATAAAAMLAAGGAALYWLDISGDGTMAAQGGPRCVTMQPWRWRWVWRHLGAAAAAHTLHEPDGGGGEELTPVPFWTVSPCTEMARGVLERHARALYRTVTERACHAVVARQGLWAGGHSLDAVPECRAHLAVGRQSLW